MSITTDFLIISKSCAYMEQQISLPIVLSTEHDPILGLSATVIPVAALVLGYNFILKPRRKRQRAA